MCSTRSYNLYTLTPIKLFITKCPRYWGRVCVCERACERERNIESARWLGIEMYESLILIRYRIASIVWHDRNELNALEAK